MSVTAAIVLVVGLIALGAGWVFWRLWRSERKACAAVAAIWEASERRRTHPDFDGLEKHFGHPLPASFRALYQDHELILSHDLLVRVPDPIEQEDECYIAWFLPADVENLRDPWPGCEGLFPFAENGAGDRFLIDPAQADPEVLYYPETGERRGMGVTLSAFLAAPRRPAPEE